MMCILVLYTFLEDTTFKDIGGFVIFLFFFYQMKALNLLGRCLRPGGSYEIGYVRPSIPPSVHPELLSESAVQYTGSVHIFERYDI